MIIIREYQQQDMAEAMGIWNEVVREGVAFPQVEELTEREADGFFSSQSYTGVAVDSETGELVGPPTPAMPSGRTNAGCTSASNL